MAQEIGAATAGEQGQSSRLSHHPGRFADESRDPNATIDGLGGPARELSDQLGAAVGAPQVLVAGAQPATRRPALALTAEGPRRADLIAWASAHYGTLRRLRLLAPAGIGALLAEHVGLHTEPLRSGTVGPAATAGLAAAGEIDAMIAFSDPIELRPGDNTTRALTRVAIFWDIPIAGNRATADLLLGRLSTGGALSATLPGLEAGGQLEGDEPSSEAAGSQPARGAIRLWNIRATLDDVPGRLAILAASLGRRAINILSVQVHLTQDGPIDELLVAASPLLSAADLSAAVVDGGAHTPRVTQADAHALVDGPTRALSLATRLLRTPDELPAVLTSLLPGVRLAWRAEEPSGIGDDPTQLWLADPTGGGYLLSRPAAPFTPAERARAYAMIDIATLAHVRPEAGEAVPESWELVLADGTQLTARRATPDDLDRVIDLNQRCSMTTRLRRYLSNTRTPSTTQLGRLLSADAGYTIVVEDNSGRLVAMANLIWPSGSNGAGTPEIGLLVEDSWQQRRVGTFLARRLLATAEELGVGRLRAVVHASNTAMVKIMSGLCAEPGHRLHREYDGGLLTLIASLRTDRR